MSSWQSMTADGESKTALLMAPRNPRESERVKHQRERGPEQDVIPKITLFPVFPSPELLLCPVMP